MIEARDYTFEEMQECIDILNECDIDADAINDIIQDVKDDMILNPDIYTVWFKIIFDEFYHFIEDHKL
jgi:hypothetical protein